MASALITFKGASSSGKNFEYSVADQEAKDLLAADGVKFSTVAGREFSFYSRTNCYLFNNTKGKAIELDIKGFSPSAGQTVNFFYNLDKTAQKQFVQDLRDTEDIKRGMKAVEKGLSDTYLFKVQMMRKQMAKLDKEMELMGMD